MVNPDGPPQGTDAPPRGQRAQRAWGSSHFNDPGARSSRRSRAAGVRTAEARERRMGFVHPSGGMPLRFGESQQRDVRRLVLRGVLAGGLAERGRRPFDVEHVVDDLEREARRRRERVERARLVVAKRPAARGTQADRRADQRAGLQPMHRLQRWQRHPDADVREVDRLSARHARGARGVRQQRAGLRQVRASARPRASANACACSASPASSAIASPNATWQVGLPRRSTSSSMHGRSSCASEYAWIISTAAAGAVDGRRDRRRRARRPRTRAAAARACRRRAPRSGSPRRAAPGTVASKASARSSASSIRRCRSPAQHGEGDVRVHRRRRRARTPSARPSPGLRSAVARP